jgi:hypothetical protein
VNDVASSVGQPVEEVSEQGGGSSAAAQAGVEKGLGETVPIKVRLPLATGCGHPLPAVVFKCPHHETGVETAGKRCLGLRKNLSAQRTGLGAPGGMGIEVPGVPPQVAERPKVNRHLSPGPRLLVELDQASCNQALVERKRCLGSEGRRP